MWLRRIIGSLVLIYGGALSVGGTQLAMAGGSPAFVPIGIGTAISGGLLLLHRSMLAAILYLVTLLAAALWSWHEVGTDVALLTPRLLVTVVVALCVLPFAFSRTPKKTTV